MLVAHYYAYMIDTNFNMSTWTYWPWMMLMIGGTGNIAGTYVGCALIIAVRRLMSFFKWNLASVIWYPVVIFEQQLLVLLILVIMILKPKGLIPENPIRIAGINYKRLMTEESELVSFKR